MTPPGEDAGTWLLVSPGLTPRAFPCADFALNRFPVISHSNECGYMLSPVHPPSESSNLGVVVGPPPSQSVVTGEREEREAALDGGRSQTLTPADKASPSPSRELWVSVAWPTTLTGPIDWPSGPCYAATGKGMASGEVAPCS